MLSSLFKEVKVPYEVFKEVKELSDFDTKKYMIDIFFPEIEAIYEAANRHNALSFQDNVCLLEAQNNNWTVITNEFFNKNVDK